MSHDDARQQPGWLPILKSKATEGTEMNRAQFQHPRLMDPHEISALHADAIATSEACKRLIEIRQLRKALQRIADLPLAAPEMRARRIAVAALGGDPRRIHLKQ